ncbi:hypothetical protein F8C76_02515 [Flagellimonas olearia]|uniref:HPP transmembrane region domain-containing protein n=1 Tax=Flagellimonas olearia TaxID=552546 RepID=A0A6I1E396_9FLAO|nr:hypothetical protein F8C76_02515 [Allomuricauda olearia]
MEPFTALWLSVAQSVSLSLSPFSQCNIVRLSTHRGATALIAVIGTDDITGLGYWYVLFPVLSGVLIMLSISLIFNNMKCFLKSYQATTNVLF